MFFICKCLIIQTYVEKFEFEFINLYFLKWAFQ